MPDEGLPELTKQLFGRADARREARYAAGAALSWRDWWTRVAADPRLAPLYAEREKIYPAEHGSAEWTPPAGWHLAALRAAGFTETGLLWRGGADATVSRRGVTAGRVSRCGGCRTGGGSAPNRGRPAAGPC